MLLAGEHEISENPFNFIIALFPTPEALDGKTLDVTGEEESAFIVGFNGTSWSDRFASLLTEKYQAKGERLDGFATEITNPSNDGCRVTFKLKRNSRPH